MCAEGAIREMIPLGRNGAAFAAFGEIVVFFPLTVPFKGVPEGVKLGDSTLSRFLLSQKSSSQNDAQYMYLCRSLGIQPIGLLHVSARSLGIVVESTACPQTRRLDTVKNSLRPTANPTSSYLYPRSDNDRRW